MPKRIADIPILSNPERLPALEAMAPSEISRFLEQKSGIINVALQRIFVGRGFSETINSGIQIIDTVVKLEEIRIERIKEKIGFLIEEIACLYKKTEINLKVDLPKVVDGFYSAEDIESFFKGNEFSDYKQILEICEFFKECNVEEVRVRRIFTLILEELSIYLEENMLSSSLANEIIYKAVISRMKKERFFDKI